MARYNRFQHGGRGVFQCAICTRATRLAQQGGDSQLCPECWELAGWQNHVLDGGDPAECRAVCDALLAKAVKQGSDAARIKKEFAELWPAP